MLSVSNTAFAPHFRYASSFSMRFTLDIFQFQECITHVTGGQALWEAGKTCLYKHLGRAKGIFSILELQVKDSFGGHNHAKFFIWGYCSPAPAGTCLESTSGALGV